MQPLSMLAQAATFTHIFTIGQQLFYYYFYRDQTGYMKKFFSVAGIVLLFLGFSLSSMGQNNFFFDQAESSIQRTVNDKRVIIPEKFRTTGLHIREMKNFLWSLPAEQRLANRNQAPVIELPMPDGTMAKFRVWESPIM